MPFSQLFLPLLLLISLLNLGCEAKPTSLASGQTLKKLQENDKVLTEKVKAIKFVGKATGFLAKDCAFYMTLKEEPSQNGEAVHHIVIKPDFTIHGQSLAATEMEFYKLKNNKLYKYSDQIPDAEIVMASVLTIDSQNDQTESQGAQNWTSLKNNKTGQQFLIVRTRSGFNKEQLEETLEQSLDGGSLTGDFSQVQEILAEILHTGHYDQSICQNLSTQEFIEEIELIKEDNEEGHDDHEGHNHYEEHNHHEDHEGHGHD